MIDQIMRCQKCELCKNQQPLLDKKKECQVIWVGLSAKRVESDNEIPLAPGTNTGMLIKKAEELCRGVSTYKTNLVKCLPLTEEKKLRYPNSKEIDCCFEHLINEIKTLNPKIVFLLGEKVYFAVGKHLDIRFEKWNNFDYCYKEYNKTYYIPIHHPSYIYVYRRRFVGEYVKGIEKMINRLL